MTTFDTLYVEFPNQYKEQTDDTNFCITCGDYIFYVNRDIMINNCDYIKTYLNIYPDILHIVEHVHPSYILYMLNLIHNVSMQKQFKQTPSVEWLVHAYLLLDRYGTCSTIRDCIFLYLYYNHALTSGTIYLVNIFGTLDLRTKLQIRCLESSGNFKLEPDDIDIPNNFLQDILYLIPLHKSSFKYNKILKQINDPVQEKQFWDYYNIHKPT